MGEGAVTVLLLSDLTSNSVQEWKHLSKFRTGNSCWRFFWLRISCFGRWCRGAILLSVATPSWHRHWLSSPRWAQTLEKTNPRLSCPSAPILREDLTDALLQPQFPGFLADSVCCKPTAPLPDLLLWSKTDQRQLCSSRVLVSVAVEEPQQWGRSPVSHQPWRHVCLHELCLNCGSETLLNKCDACCLSVNCFGCSNACRALRSRRAASAIGYVLPLCETSPQSDRRLLPLWFCISAILVQRKTLKDDDEFKSMRQLGVRWLHFVPRTQRGTPDIRDFGYRSAWSSMKLWGKTNGFQRCWKETSRPSHDLHRRTRLRLSGSTSVCLRRSFRAERYTHQLLQHGGNLWVLFFL